MIKVDARSVVTNNRVVAHACIQQTFSHCVQIAGYNGTFNYILLKNKPQINGVELVGDISQDELILLGNGLDFDNNHAIEIQDWVIFDCGSSTEGIT